MSRLIKWAGGKEQELRYILPNLPDQFNNYYEPFVGGGSVYTAINANGYFINDRSEELISFYQSIVGAQRDIFFHTLEILSHRWDEVSRFVANNINYFFHLYQQYRDRAMSLSNLMAQVQHFVADNTPLLRDLLMPGLQFGAPLFYSEIEKNLMRKIPRMRELEEQKGQLPAEDVADNIETAFKSAFYMLMRHIYNNLDQYNIDNILSSVLFFFIRNFSYSGMFRYNNNGEFNVPYGGIAYNKKDLSKNIQYLRSEGLRELLGNTVIENMDFEQFLALYPPQENDFIFLDPPYDSEFSTYARNEFSREDQRRLATYLIENCPARWMMIIKNTDYILDLYNNRGLNISRFDKKYMVSFMNRNDKDVQHLMIKNY